MTGSLGGSGLSERMGRARIAVGGLATVALFVLPVGASAGRLTPPVRPGARIVGGKVTTVERVPWQVAVARSPSAVVGNAYERQICGGTLVAPTLVVTAAHCLVNDSGDFKPADRLSVISGRSKLRSAAGLETALSTYVVFVDDRGRPLYDPKTNSWDVALLQLAQPALGTPIELAGPDERKLWSVGRAAYVSGWGARSAIGPYPDRLRATEIGIFADGRCDRVYGQNWDPRTSICAGTFLGRRDTCFGDSGGPLVVPTSGGEVRLVGDTQFGRTCGSPSSPGGYGRLAAQPVRDALAQAAFELTGDTIVGSGGLPPTALGPAQGRELAWSFAERSCRRDAACRRYRAGGCRPTGSGFVCATKLYAQRDGRAWRCERRVFVTVDSGRPRELGRGRRRCRRVKPANPAAIVAKRAGGGGRTRGPGAA